MDNYNDFPISNDMSDSVSQVLGLNDQGMLTLTNVPGPTQTIPNPPSQDMVADPNVALTSPQPHLYEGFQQTENPFIDFTTDATSYQAPVLSPYASFDTMNVGSPTDIYQNTNVQSMNVGSSTSIYQNINVQTMNVGSPTGIYQNTNNVQAVNEQPRGQLSGVFQPIRERITPMVSRDHISPLLQMRLNDRSRNTGKQPVYETSGFKYSGYKHGAGFQRLNHYVFQQRNRPQDNNIWFWRNFVAEFFAPSATMSWCVSSYNSCGQLGNDYKVGKQCEMCSLYPSYCFVINGNLLANLHKIKFDNGVLDERVRIENPIERVDARGQIILCFPKASEEVDFHQTRVVRHGQLRVVLTPELKISVWEFCIQRHVRHEEYVPRNSFNPLVGLLGNVGGNYQNLGRGGGFDAIPPKDMVVSTAYKRAEALGMAYLSQLGIVRRYVPCLQQISDLPNFTNEWMDYSLTNGTTPAESMANFTEQRQHSSSARNFSALAGPVTESGFCNRGRGKTKATTSTSMGFNNQKRQRGCPVDPRVGFSSSRSSSYFNLSRAASTPSFDIQPQLHHTTFGKSGQQSSAANNLLMEPKNSLSDADLYIQRLKRVRQNDGTEKVNGLCSAAPASGTTQNLRQNSGAGVSESQNGYTLQNISSALANSTGCDGNSNRILHIDVENYEVTGNGVSSSAPASGTTQSVRRNRGASVSGNQNGIMQNSSSARANSTSYDGNSNRIVHIDVESYECKGKGVSSSAPASGTALIAWQNRGAGVSENQNGIMQNISNALTNSTTNDGNFVDISVEDYEVKDINVNSYASASGTTWGVLQNRGAVLSENQNGTMKNISNSLANNSTSYDGNFVDISVEDYEVKDNGASSSAPAPASGTTQGVWQNRGSGNSENENGTMQNVSNAVASSTIYDGNVNGIVDISVADYEVKDNGVTSSAPAGGTTQGVWQNRGADISENQDGIMQTVSNALANSTVNDGNSNGIVDLSVEDHEVMDNGVSSSAPAGGTAQGVWQNRGVDVSENQDLILQYINNALADSTNGASSSAPASGTTPTPTPTVEKVEDVFPRDTESNYLPQEYNKIFFNEVIDLDELRDVYD